MWYVITFMVGSFLGCLGMAILACGARADDRMKMIRMQRELADWERRDLADTMLRDLKNVRT